MPWSPCLIHMLPSAHNSAWNLPILTLSNRDLCVKPGGASTAHGTYTPTHTHTPLHTHSSRETHGDIYKSAIASDSIYDIIACDIILSCDVFQTTREGENKQWFREGVHLSSALEKSRTWLSLAEREPEVCEWLISHSRAQPIRH